ncbi:hypothetical protein MD484_g7493, partial [Candolleomyces efflorescens]
MPTLSNEAPSEPSPATTAGPEPIRFGGIIFFKVEDTVFEAPRSRFAEHSEVFETMFCLPAGRGETVEGRDEDHPVVLEGYQASHFHALLKVLYPTPDNMISGSIALDKDGWIGVFNLATRWSMKKIRQLAIKGLLKSGLSPVEKVALGREHKVASWFREGLTELVSEHPIRPLVELKAQLGPDLACTVLWIQNRALAASKPREQGLVITGLSLGMLACWYCKTAMLSSDRNCHSCSQPIAVDDRGALYLGPGPRATYIDTLIPASGPATSAFCVNIQYVMCRSCSNCALPTTNLVCPSGSCLRTTNDAFFNLKHDQIVTEGDSVSRIILEEFADEIASYESWDQ